MLKMEGSLTFLCILLIVAPNTMSSTVEPLQDMDKNTFLWNYTTDETTHSGDNFSSNESYYFQTEATKSSEKYDGSTEFNLDFTTIGNYNMEEKNVLPTVNETYEGDSMPALNTSEVIDDARYVTTQSSTDHYIDKDDTDDVTDAHDILAPIEIQSTESSHTTQAATTIEPTQTPEIVFPTLAPTPELQACPIGCRCTAPPRVEHRHYWHRLLAQYRMRKLLYGYRPHRYGFKSNSIRKKPFKGREMICVGLKDIPDYVPNDVSKVTIYGKLREVWEYQQEQAYLNDQGISDDDDDEMSYSDLNQITSVSKLNVIPSAGMKRLWVEGNRIKVLHPTDFTMLGKLRYLHLRNNRLKLLSTGAFQSLQDIHEIDLSENHLKNELKTTFTGLHQLRKVVLAKNRLVSLHSRTFGDLTNLEYLDVSYNLITDLPADIFTNNEELRHVDLSYNNLSVLKFEWFANLFSLQKLFLKGNRFHRIPANIFSPLGNLTHINLDKNRIREITQTSFSGLESLIDVRIQHNNISFIEDGSFANVTALKDLHLDHNNLDHVSLDLFRGLDNLTTLTLSNNKIKGVSRNVFENLGCLEKLDLSNNFIQTLKYRNFFGLQQLKVLRLDHNKITTIEHDAFAVSLMPNLSKLTWLYLNFNELGALTGKSFSGLSYLKFLNLGHNKIELIDDHTFSIMSKLNTLIMSSNRIPYLRSALFRNLRSLRHMNLGSNLLETLEDDVLYGLFNLEDLSLQNNEIYQLNNGVFLDTPKMNSLNVKKNKLRYLDLDIVDSAPNLKYLDLGQNHLSDLKLPQSAHRVLKFLSLADNSLEHLSAQITDVMSYLGKLSLYGNPWSCECELAWILDNGLSFDNATGFDHQVVLEGKEEIECKTPKFLTGERLSGLDPEYITCANETDGVLNEVYESMFADQSSNIKQLGCSFSLYRTPYMSEQDNGLIREEPLQWVATIFDEHMNRLCSGVRLGVKHILTHTQCWKDVNVHKIIVQFGSSNKNGKWFKAEYGSVEHFEGPLDYSVLRIQRPEVQLTKRVFPCLLNNDGFGRVIKEKPNAVVSSAMNRELRNSRLKSIKGHVITEPCVDGYICLKFNNVNHNLTVYEKTELPIFVKVGNTRWALAGFGDIKRYGNILVTPIKELVNWAHRFIR